MTSVLDAAALPGSAEVGDTSFGESAYDNPYQCQQSWKFPMGMQNTWKVSLNQITVYTEIDIVSVVGQFTDQWKHPTQVPAVIRVWLFGSCSR